MTTKFTVEFRTGNVMFADNPEAEDSMVSGRAIADVLREIAASLDDVTIDPAARTSGYIRDENSGTLVGHWEHKEET